MKDNYILDKVGQLLRAFLWNMDFTLHPSLNANLATVLFKQPPAASRSSYVSEKTNVVANVTESTINRTPCIAQSKPVEINRTFVFHPFLETTP
jgi:hypothetical protein